MDSNHGSTTTRSSRFDRNSLALGEYLRGLDVEQAGLVSTGRDVRVDCHGTFGVVDVLIALPLAWTLFRGSANEGENEN